MSSKYIPSYLIFVAFAVCLILYPGDKLMAASNLTQRQWVKLTKDKAFGYAPEKEMKEVKKADVSSNFLANAIASLFAFFSTSIGKTLVWLFFFSVLAYMLFRIIVNEKTSFFRRKKEPPVEDSVDTELLPEDLLKTNWEEHLRRAKTEGNTRLVIRYSYMMMLQLLQRKHLIQYRSDKTNYDYYYELTSTSFKQPFRILTRQYEYAWYGNYTVTADDYREYTNTFDTLKSQLS